MSPNMPGILLTRPMLQAERFAADIHARLGPDVEILISPLLRVEPTGAVIPNHHAAIFTSENGVRSVARVPAGALAYCVGDRTAAVARRAGYRVVSADGNAGALIEVIRQSPQTEFLHIRGAQTRGNVAQTLGRAGHRVTEVITYRQVAQPLSDAAYELIRRGDPVFVPLFSPGTAVRFAANADWANARLRIVAISTATAQSIGDLRVESLFTCDRPTAAAMLDALERQFTA